jgi:hypothetical protein
MDFAFVAGADFAASQAVGVGMLTVFNNLTDHDFVELWRTEIFNFFDIEAEKWQDLLQAFRRMLNRIEIDIVFKPVVGNFHEK